jgi:hypothetical protein
MTLKTHNIKRHRRHAVNLICVHAPRGCCANLHFKEDTSLDSWLANSKRPQVFAQHAAWTGIYNYIAAAAAAVPNWMRSEADN